MKSHKRTMADTLPTELIENIGKRLNTKSDISRFRAVCRSWRSSIPPVYSRLKTFYLKFWHPDRKGYSTQTVEETVVYYHLGSSPDQAVKRDWLVKLRMRTPVEGGQVINLLGGFELARAYETYGSRVFVTSTDSDSPDFTVIHGGRLYHGNTYGPEKVYFCQKNLNACLVNLYRVDDLCSTYGDAILYRGMFYSVTKGGRAVVVDCFPDSDLVFTTTIAGELPHTGNDNVKRLVESSGDLLLVERSTGPKFKVYKLNAVRMPRVEKQWVEMQASDLSDRIWVVLYDQHCAFLLLLKISQDAKGTVFILTLKKILGSVFDMSSGTVSGLKTIPPSARIFRRRRNKKSNRIISPSTQQKEEETNIHMII